MRKSETTVDREENIKLVKQIQMEVLKKYAPTYQILTQITNVMLSNKVSCSVEPCYLADVPH